MNEDQRHQPSIGSLTDSEMVGELIRRAGARACAEDYDPCDIKQEALARWEGMVARRRRRRTRRVAAAALAIAATLGGLTVALRVLAPPATPAPLGVVELVVDALRSNEAPGRGLLAVGDSFPARTPLRTSAVGRAALRLDNGIRIRLDRDSEVSFTHENRLQLARGAVYVDATAAPAADYLDVETALGVARDIGTVFQVRQGDSGVTIQVREGRVAVRHREARYEADAGQEMRLSADGAIETSEVALSGPEWDWAGEAAPAFEMEGSTLGAFLDWLRRETGWYVRFEGGDRDALRSTLLHGSLEGLAPHQTLDLVLPGCGLSYRIQDGALILEPEETVRTRT